MEVLLPLILILAAFYLLILGPRRAQARRAADLNAHLRPGVEIITTAGVLGRVTRVDEDEVHVEIAPGVVIRLLKGAVGKILDPEDAAAATEVPGDTSASGDTTDEGGKGSGPGSSTSY